MPTDLSLIPAALRAAGLTLPAVDGHAHLWVKTNLPSVVRPALEVRPDLNADFKLGTYLEMLQGSGVEYLMAVQARDPADKGLREAGRFSELWEADNLVAGVVAGIDLTKGERVFDELEGLQTLPGIRGVRCIHPENHGVGIYNTSAAIRAAVTVAEAGYTLDLLFRCSNPGQLEEVTHFTKVALAGHSRPMVVDHLGKPLGLSTGTVEKNWIEAMRDLGKTQRVYVKLSAMRGEAGADANRTNFFPFLDVLLETFGPNYLIWGSDHPISHNYGDCVLDATEWIVDRGLQRTNIANRLFHQNVVDAYQLQLRS